MKKRYAVVIGFVGVLAAAQLIRPDFASSPTDPQHAVGAQLGASSSVTAVLNRSCSQCHSNASAWPSYAHVAPLSWIAASAVKEGRKAVNFSEWTSYSPEEQHRLLLASCSAASAGTMPGATYTFFDPSARLSADDVRAICSAARGQERTSVENTR